VACDEPQYQPTPLEIILPLAEALGLTLDAVRAPEEQLLDYLGDKQMLLILENITPSAAHTQVLRAILRAAPAVRVVAIAEQSLHLLEEMHFSVEGWLLPQASSLDWRKEDAVKLFLQSAAAVRPLVEGEIEQAIQICQLVRGLPLAVTVAASLVDRCPLATLATMVDDNLNRPPSAGLSTQAQDQVLWAVLDAS
jgi:predicted ATPase